MCHVVWIGCYFCNGTNRKEKVYYVLPTSTFSRGTHTQRYNSPHLASILEPRLTKVPSSRPNKSSMEGQELRCSPTNLLVAPSPSAASALSAFSISGGGCRVSIARVSGRVPHCYDMRCATLNSLPPSRADWMEYDTLLLLSSHNTA
jgi:hypothetical protein